jgi:hypothetical protein
MTSLTRVRPPVLALLALLGSEHSRVIADPRPNFSDGGESQFPTAKRAITAAIKGFRSGDLLADGVFMEFKFDAADRLLGFKVEYIYTFL